MTPSSYLFDLAMRLGAGLSRLPEPFRTRHARFVLRSQAADGGFAGRHGASNLYYTNFGLQSAHILGISDSAFWKRLAGWLRAAEPEDTPDVLTLLMGRAVLQLRGQTLWCEACSADHVEAARKTLERFACADGGFARSPGDGASNYHTFLAQLCYDFLGGPMPGRYRAAQIILSRQCSDGGFADLSDDSAEGTNQSAAAVSFLKAAGHLTPEAAGRAATFLHGMQATDGGFLAHPSAPMTDLMSTFTALVALDDAGSLRSARLGAAGRYVQRLSAPNGGFPGTTGDTEPDIEYTYYGLGTAAILANQLRGDKS